MGCEKSSNARCRLTIKVRQPSQRQTAHDNTKRQPAGAGCLHCRVLPDLPMTHIDDWLDEPATNETEKQVKEWLEHYRRPAAYKDHRWLSARVLLCDYEGKRYRCIGCSRMGDVWLTTNFEAEYGYEKRIDVTGCSNWEVRQNVQSCADRRSNHD